MKNYSTITRTTLCTTTLTTTIRQITRMIVKINYKICDLFLYLYDTIKHSNIDTIMNVTYNNKVLSAQEREEFRMMSEETIQVFAESIEHYYVSSQMLNPHNNIHDKITKTTLDVGLFTSYTFCDCIILLKQFILSSNSYEKSLFRGKLKVLLNEGFKRLYGFNDKQRKESYYIKLGEVINHFPGFQPEYNSILAHLQQFSEQSNWWKDERNSEVHLDMKQLYKTRHEEINESKVAMESNQLLILCNRVNYLILMMTGAHIQYMEKHLNMDRSKTAE